MLAALLEFVRDLAFLAAAAGVAWWCWDQYRTSTERGDQAARLSLTAERQSVELKQWAEKLDERTLAISSHLAQLGQIAQLVQSAQMSAQVAQSAQAALLAESRAAANLEDAERSAAAARDDEARMAARVRVHRLLQSTTDPFLTFVEIERALANVGRLASGDRDAVEEGRPDAGDWLSGDRLRRVLIDLVSDGVVAQLDRDRYFIASDYEAGDESSGGDDGDGSDAA